MYRYNEVGAIRKNVQTGHIYALNIHGTIRYITKQENNNIDYLQLAALCFFLLTGLLWYFDRIRDVSKKTDRHQSHR
jgi:Na+-transporting NADH:ubiquinone oxidoreductase subunit NqrD